MIFCANNVTKKYKNGNGIENISLKVTKGEIVALIGENGAGKSTFMKCITGDILLDSGDLLYKNKDLNKNENLSLEIGSLINISFFDYLNAFDNLKLIILSSGIIDKNEINRRINEVMNLVGLSKKKYDKVKTFSFGMKQRLGLAQALLCNPQFLILDEPFVGLDPLGKNIIKNVLIKMASEENIGIIFSSHDLYDISEICDRIVMFKNGKKVMDQIFDFKKIYKIYIEKDKIINIKTDILQKFDNNVVFKENFIQFVDYRIINDIIELLYKKNIKIIDFYVQENILNDFFYDGDKND